VRCEGETEVFGEMERIYSRGKYVGQIRNFGKCNRVGGKI